MIDHDRLFKELLSTFFIEFVELFSLDMLTYLDRDSLIFLDKEVFTDVTAGDRYEADIVVKAQVAGAETFFLVHLEHQAQVQADFGQRMFRYFARLHEKYALPIYPIALFSYATPLRPEPDAYRVVFPDKTVLEFRYTTIQLNRLNWRDFVQQPNPIASALMAKMRIAPEDRPRVKLECLRLLATLRLDRARMHLISGFVDTYLRLTALEQQDFQQALQTIIPPEQEDVMEIVTSWMEQGIEQGIEQGALQKARDSLLLVLKVRFGAVPMALEESINALADKSMLTSLLEQAVLADSLITFQHGLAQH